MPDKSTPATTSRAYDRLEILRKPCRDLKAGWAAVTDPANAAVYLPREAMEVPVPNPKGGWIDPWLNRIKRARLTPFFRDAVDALSGKAFSKEPKPSADMPEQLQEFLEDVDLQGNDFAVFALDRCANSVAEGIDFVLVDYPAVPATEVRSKEDDKRSGLAPFWCAYSAGSVIAWKAEKRGGNMRLLEVRLKETVTESDGYGEACVDQIRGFFAGNPDASDDTRFVSWVIWRKNANDEWFVFAEGIRRPQVDIPLVDVSTDATGFFEASPPLYDLAQLNLAHLRKCSDLDSAQHQVGFPVLSWSGVSVEEATKQLNGGLGSNRFFISPQTGGGMEYVEPQGSSWDALEKSIETISQDCARAASDPLLSSSPGNLTATGEAIRASKASSKFGAWVSRWEDAFSMLLMYTAIDLQIVAPGAEDGWGSIELNKTFLPTDRNIEGARLAVDRNNAGKLSDETTFTVLQAAEVIPDGVEYEDEQARLRQQAPALGEIGRGPQMVRRVMQLMQDNPGMTGEEATARVEAEDGSVLPFNKPQDDQQDDPEAKGGKPPAPSRDDSADPGAPAVKKGAQQEIQVERDAVLNGAQITAATAIVAGVAAGTLPRDAGIGQLTVLFNLSPAQADQMMGSAGKGVATNPNPNPAEKVEPAA